MITRLPFRWPRALFVTSLLILPKSGARVDMAALSVAIEDETQQQLISTGTYSGNAATLFVNGLDGPSAAPALSLTGQVPMGPLFEELVLVRPFALQRPVNTGDQWFLSVQNTRPLGPSIQPEIYFDIEDGRR